jgi:hypothetical protein
MKNIRIITALISIFTLCSLAIAADERTVVRVYNVSDLLWARKDYPFESGINMPPTMPPTRGEGVDPRQFARGEGGGGGAGGGGGGGGGGANPAAAANGLFGQKPAQQQQHQDTIISQLSDLLVETIDPPSWVQNGGFGTLRSLGGMLIISQSPANHDALAKLLGEIRTESSKLVTVHAHWVLLQSEELEALAGKRDEKQGSAAQEIDSSALSKLGSKVVHYRGQTSCFNGQTVHLVSGRGRTAITKVTAVTGDNVGLYDPDAQVVQSGAMLQITPMLSQDGKQAVVDLQSVVSEWDPAPAGVEVKEPTTRPSAATATLDRVNVLVQQLRTTVQVPVGKPVLVGGMTFEPSTKGGNSPQLYLIIEVSAGN